MDENSQSAVSRRSLLSTVGAGFALGSVARVGAAGGRDDTGYVLAQGGDCVPVRPIRGRLPVETFYEYQLPSKHVSDANGAVAGETAQYASVGTRNLQREQTSVAFLYQGPKGISLVVVHGSIDNSDAGAVTFRISGLPDDGDWVVRDDFYRDPETGDVAPSNYDRWNVDGDPHRIDWTWGSAGTDGGAFRGLGEAFAVTVDPAFNEAAALYGEHYEGDVSAWQFLSGSAGVSERIALEFGEPIRIATGECESRDERAGERDDEDRDDDEETDEEDDRDDDDEDRKDDDRDDEEDETNEEDKEDETNEEDKEDEEDDEHDD